MIGLKIKNPYVILFIICLTHFSPAGAQSSRIVIETLLSKIALHEMYNNTYTISSNLKSVAFRIRKNNKIIAVIDTLKGKEYDDVNLPVFNSDAKHFAYTARNNSNWLIIHDNKQEVLLDTGLTVTFLRFEPNSNKLVYILNNGQKDYLVYNGKRHKAYDKINENSIVFSNNNKIAYTATLKNKQFNILDTNEGIPFDRVGYPVFNPNGLQIAYWGTTGKNSFVINGNNKSKSFDVIGSIKFSEDGKHIVYDVQKNGKHFVVMDGTENEMHEYLHSYQVSPDGSRLVYGIKTTPANGEEFTEYAVIDGKKEGPYEELLIESFVFSPDGKELVYAAQLPGNLTDEEALQRPEEAYEWFVVRHGKPQTHYNVLQGSIVFSPNSLRLAYAGEKYVKRVVNIDGKEETPYDDVYFITFSPDSKHLAYTVKSGNKEYVVIDGIIGRPYDALVGQKEIIFDSADSFHYLAIKEDTIYLVEEKIK